MDLVYCGGQAATKQKAGLITAGSLTNEVAFESIE
jgi:hypothetical protein